jgi:ferredoxin-NADP reductase
MKDKKCFTGMITKDFVIKQIPDHRQRIFYIFGPPGMVSAMSGICSEIGCLSENVKVENFIGY